AVCIGGSPASAHHLLRHSFPTRRSSDLAAEPPAEPTPADRTAEETARARAIIEEVVHFDFDRSDIRPDAAAILERKARVLKANPDRKSTRLNSSHVKISYAVFCLKKKKM